MKELHLLVVDDDNLVLQAIRMALPSSWYLIGANSPQDIPHKKFHAAFVDMHLKNTLKTTEGVKVIENLRKADPHLDIVAISGDLDRDLMEKCLKAGASRFLAKPLNKDEFLITLDKIEAHLLLHAASNRSGYSHLKWIGTGAASDKVRRQIAELKGEDGPILIEGESGTGKEVVAHLLHSQADRELLVNINVAAIPENLFESEFFGHTKGAFTGADQNKMGLAEAAHGGDLFLDEIEALTLPHQAKLLRFLENGEIRRLGANAGIKVQTRVIAATNKSLEEMVREKLFREDLLWRLKGKKIKLPALRERPEDIGVLCQHFFSMDKARNKELSDEALNLMQHYSWPGNVRELKRVCEQLIVSSPLPIIRAEDVLPLIQPHAAGAVPSGSLDYSRGLATLINDFEAHVLEQCLEKVRDIDHAAKLLKISRSSLYKKLKDHNVKWRT